MKFTNEFLKETFKKYNEKYFNNRVQPVFLAWNNRTTKTLGTCRYINDEPYKIEVSSKYVKQYPEELKNILVHEMIHVLYPKDSHGELFRKEMNRLNKEFPELDIRVFANNLKVYWKYKYNCSICGQNGTTARKLPSHAVCGNCYVPFELYYTRED